MAEREAVVLYDAIRYKDADGNVQEALKGDKVSLTSDEFTRLTGFKGRNGEDDPAVAAPRSKDAKDAQADATTESGGTTASEAADELRAKAAADAKADKK